MSDSTERWVVERDGDGENSMIRVRNENRIVAWRMSQAESRELLDKLSKVTVMPPRRVG